jgi:hypothetical protein
MLQTYDLKITSTFSESIQCLLLSLWCWCLYPLLAAQTMTVAPVNVKYALKIYEFMNIYVLILVGTLFFQRKSTNTLNGRTQHLMCPLLGRQQRCAVFVKSVFIRFCVCILIFICVFMMVCYFFALSSDISVEMWKNVFMFRFILVFLLSSDFPKHRFDLFWF